MIKKIEIVEDKKDSKIAQKKIILCWFLFF